MCFHCQRPNIDKKCPGDTVEMEGLQTSGVSWKGHGAALASKIEPNQWCSAGLGHMEQ
jgi:hypothetical protein